MKVIIYTDGSCINNPGPGGCCSIIKMNNKEKIFKSGFYYTTNNRMELMGLILSLNYLHKINNISNICVYTDSLYMLNGVNVWIKKWKYNYWKKSNNSYIKNSDLWCKINIYLNFFKGCLKLYYVKSHFGNKYNEICDKIAFSEAKNPYLDDI